MTGAAIGSAVSVMPASPAIGASTKRLPPHLPVAESSPTGQRAASTAARATSVRTHFSQRGPAMPRVLPSGPRISGTAVSAQ